MAAVPGEVLPCRPVRRVGGEGDPAALQEGDAVVQGVVAAAGELVDVGGVDDGAGGEGDEAGYGGPITGRGHLQ